MGKIKVLYDVAKVMQDKQVLNGTLQVEVLAGSEKVWELNGEFNKNRVTGLRKVKIRTELSHNGETLIHEGTTEYKGDGHCCFKHRRHGHHEHGTCKWGSGSRWGFITTALKLLSDMSIDEESDGSKQITLRVDEVPEELKLHCLKVLKQPEGAGRHHRIALLHEIFPLSEATFSLKVSVSSSNEIRDVHFVLQGKKINQDCLDETITLRGKFVLN